MHVGLRKYKQQCVCVHGNDGSCHPVQQYDTIMFWGSVGALWYRGRRFIRLWTLFVCRSNSLLVYEAKKWFEKPYQLKYIQGVHALHESAVHESGVCCAHTEMIKVFEYVWVNVQTLTLDVQSLQSLSMIIQLIIEVTSGRLLFMNWSSSMRLYL